MIDVENNRQRFEQWWNAIGSGLSPLPDEDMEEFAYRVTWASWKASEPPDSPHNQN